MVIPDNAQAIGTRSEQQDAFGFMDKDDSALVDRCGLLAVVADGMGGLAMGQQAKSDHRRFVHFITCCAPPPPDDQSSGSPYEAW